VRICYKQMQVQGASMWVSRNAQKTKKKRAIMMRGLAPDDGGEAAVANGQLHDLGPLQARTQQCQVIPRQVCCAQRSTALLLMQGKACSSDGQLNDSSLCDASGAAAAEHKPLWQ